jgi:multiple sugar transport system permease protein
MTKHRKPWRKTVVTIASRTTLVVAVVLFFLPIIWAVMMSLKTRVDALAMPPKWVFTPTLSNFRTVWNDSHFLQYAKNSLIVAVTSTGVGLLLGVPAAYVLARNRFRGQRVLLLGILATRMIPPVAFVIPFFIIFSRLSLNDTHTGLIIIHLTFILGYVMWMMRSYFMDIPRDIEEAAFVDGCGMWQTFFRIVLPISTPGLSTSAIFSFIFSWNEFLYAMVLTTVNAKTVPLGVYTWVAYEEIMWGELTAASVIAAIPVLVFYGFVQKALVRGLTMGAVKG